MEREPLRPLEIKPNLKNKKEHMPDETQKVKRRAKSRDVVLRERLDSEVSNPPEEKVMWPKEAKPDVDKDTVDTIIEMAKKKNAQELMTFLPIVTPDELHNAIMQAPTIRENFIAAINLANKKLQGEEPAKDEKNQLHLMALKEVIFRFVSQPRETQSPPEKEEEKDAYTLWEDVLTDLTGRKGGKAPAPSRLRELTPAIIDEFVAIANLRFEKGSTDEKIAWLQAGIDTPRQAAMTGYEREVFPIFSKAITAAIERLKSNGTPINPGEEPIEAPSIEARPSRVGRGEPIKEEKQTEPQLESPKERKKKEAKRAGMKEKEKFEKEYQAALADVAKAEKVRTAKLTQRARRDIREAYDSWFNLDRPKEYLRNLRKLEIDVESEEISTTETSMSSEQHRVAAEYLRKMIDAAVKHYEELQSERQRKTEERARFRGISGWVRGLFDREAKEEALRSAKAGETGIKKWAEVIEEIKKVQVREQ